MKTLISILMLLAYCLPLRAELAPEQALEGLLRAATCFHDTLSCEGGYLWKYKADLSEQWGEQKATKTQIWVQPPGTPSVGLLLLSAWQVTGEQRYLDWARQAGYALATGQLASGGWDYWISFSSEGALKHYRLSDSRAGKAPRIGQLNQSTFDDNTTQSALRLLMALDRALNQQDEKIHTAAQEGLKCLWSAQFRNGAWPQRFPLSPLHYSRYATFNDNAMNDCLLVMLEAAATYDDELWHSCALRCGDYILASQLPAPQAGWAQQYTDDGKPAPARWFEPAAVCSAVTARNLRTLLTLHSETADEKWLAPFPAALEWLRNSRLPNGKWARFYELRTNKPLYVTNDRKIINEYTDEVRPGYSWEGDWGIDSLELEYLQLLGELASGAWKQQRPFDFTTPPAPRTYTPEQIAELAKKAETVLASLDEQGRWVREDGWIYSEDFLRNCQALLEYLGAVPAEADRKD